MATELAKAYVQIVPSAKGIHGAITKELGGEASSAGDSAGESFGNKLVSKVKTVIAAAGIGKFLASAISEGADLEQSLGGIETLFKDSAGTMKAYANEAYRTAGLSANEYMETATGFAASLVSSLGGNTAAAAELANTAITDMSDNANKMGTDMQSIQDAYQGFAKQNYTMLDNLKLGYGGTQSEMARLINDSGVLGDTMVATAENVNSIGFDKMIEAIHVVQSEMGITGTTAAEAADTISGSLASMKAAWSNVLGNLALGNDLTGPLNALADTVGTFVGKNLIPALGNIFSALPGMLSTIVKKIGPGLIQSGANLVGNLARGILNSIPDLLDAAMDMLSSMRDYIADSLPDLFEEGASCVASFAGGIFEGLPETVKSMTEIINGLIEAIMGSLPRMIRAGFDMISSMAQGILNSLPTILASVSSIISTLLLNFSAYLPVILQMGVQFIGSMASGFLQAMPTIITNMGNILNSTLAFLMASLPQIMQAGFDMISNLAQGIMNNLPAILSAITEVVSNLLNTLVSYLPDILEKGKEIILNLVTGIINNIPSIISAIAEAIAKLLAEIASHLPEILQSGITMIGELAAGLIKAIPDLVAKIPEIITGIKDAFLEFDWAGLGKDIINGIGNGIKNAAGALWDGVKSVGSSIVDGFKGLFKIGSPSKLMEDEIGRFVPEGIAVGITGNLKPIQEAMKEATDATMSAANMAVNSGTAEAARMVGSIPENDNSNLANKLDAVLKILAKYLPDCAKETVIDGDSLTKELDRRLGLAVM